VSFFAVGVTRQPTATSCRCRCSAAASTIAARSGPAMPTPQSDAGCCHRPASRPADYPTIRQRKQRGLRPDGHILNGGSGGMRMWNIATDQSVVQSVTGQERQRGQCGVQPRPGIASSEQATVIKPERDAVGSGDVIWTS
jgi:hypothetical protein